LIFIADINIKELLEREEKKYDESMKRILEKITTMEGDGMYLCVINLICE
jgi:hypothetical protein